MTASKTRAEGMPTRDDIEKHLGPLEAQVMQTLWNRGPSTVREVLEVVGTEKSLAYTTVMTVLSRLTDKGLVLKDTTERAYRYRPAKSLKEFRTSISGQMVEQVMTEFGEVAITQFVQHLKQIDPERLRKLLDLIESEQGKGQR